MANFKAAPESSAERYARQKFMENNPELRDIPMINLTSDLRKAGMIRSFPKVGPHKEEGFHEMISPMYDAAYELGMDWREGKREQKKRAIEIQQEMEAQQNQFREDFEREAWRRYFELKDQGLNPKTPSFPWDEEPTPEFPSDKDLINFGSNEPNPQTIDSERGRANGGRIGFQDGKTLDFEVYKFYFMNALGMDEDQAEKATEQELYGPDSAKLRDSKKGIGSMMASMDNDSAPNAEVIEPRFDAGGQEELLREIESQGGLRTASTQDEMADVYALYDSAVENGFPGSFEEFIQLMMIEANKGQSMKGAEGLASLVA